MFRIQAQTEVRRPAKDVSAYLARIENEPNWQKDVVHVQLLRGTPGSKGAAYERVQVVGGRNIKTETELVEHRAGEAVAFQGKGKVIDIKVGYDLKPKNSATEVTMRLEGELLGFAAMFESMAAEGLEKLAKDGLAKLKSVLEA